MKMSYVFSVGAVALLSASVSMANISKQANPESIVLEDGLEAYPLKRQRSVESDKPLVLMYAAAGGKKSSVKKNADKRGKLTPQQKKSFKKSKKTLLKQNKVANQNLKKASKDLRVKFKDFKIAQKAARASRANLNKNRAKLDRLNSQAIGLSGLRGVIARTRAKRAQKTYDKRLAKHIAGPKAEFNIADNNLGNSLRNHQNARSSLFGSRNALVLRKSAKDTARLANKMRNQPAGVVPFSRSVSTANGAIAPVPVVVKANALTISNQRTQAAALSGAMLYLPPNADARQGRRAAPSTSQKSGAELYLANGASARNRQRTGQGLAVELSGYAKPPPPASANYGAFPPARSQYTAPAAQSN